jgi:YegS/Rv2252/BmrU family lipid kinase
MTTAFRANGFHWDLAITKESGDGQRLAQQAVSAGADIVAVYGGDGTTTEVASGLQGSRAALGILPGGTTNAIAQSLGIPTDLAGACALIAAPQPALRPVYLGQANDKNFMQVVGVGLPAKMIEKADREQKDKLGWFAYGLATLQALADPPHAVYHLELDGEQIEEEGITCLVINADNLNIPGLRSIPPYPRNGLLDVVVARKADLASIIAVANAAASGNINVDKLMHWQARQVTVTTDPPQPIQYDGELLGDTPLTVRVVEKPVQVIVPPEKLPENGAGD